MVGWRQPSICHPDCWRPWFWRVALAPGSVSVLVHREGRGYTLTSLNEAGHLKGEPGSPDDE